ncbi:DUF2490 domain-containing protein [Chitinophagales bacterium]|nr:DUF2490 domain-containing protein [Chitinophagales bacterium]
MEKLSFVSNAPALYRVFIFLFLSCLFTPRFSQAQERDFGNWLIYIGNKKVKNKFNIHHEVQCRNYNAVGDLEQLLLRTGLGYSFNDNKNNALAGYGYILSQNYKGTNDKISIHEHRIYQQFTAKQNIESIILNHRYRFEQRFVGKDFKLRFRYFLSVKIPLAPWNAEVYHFYLSGYNEIFLNTKSAVFDRNRLYGGLGYKLNDSFSLELGYMNQFFEENSRDQFNIITFVNF